MNFKESSDPGEATISVEAPVTLAGGYVLDVEQNGRVFPVTVPECGVSRGQIFQAELPLPVPIAPPSNEDIVVPLAHVIPLQTSSNVQSHTPIFTTTKCTMCNSNGTQTTIEETIYSDGTVVNTSITTPPNSGVLQESIETLDQMYADVPKGPWRYPLFECCNMCCNGMCWMAWCCTFIPIGQIMQRLKLDANGYPGNYKNTCKIWTALWAGFVVCFILSTCWTPFLLIASFAVSLYAFCVLVKTRYYMRRRYNIPSCCCKAKKCCNGCSNDCCCVLWCLPCVVCQMMSHTHDHNKYRYNWHSPTGLDEDSPEIREEEGNWV